MSTGLFGLLKNIFLKTESDVHFLKTESKRVT